MKQRLFSTKTLVAFRCSDPGVGQEQGRPQDCGTNIKYEIKTEGGGHGTFWKGWLSPWTINGLGSGVDGLGLVGRHRSGLVGRLGNWLVNGLRSGLVCWLGGLVGRHRSGLVCGSWSRLVSGNRGRLVSGSWGRLVRGLRGDVGGPLVGRCGLGLVHGLIRAGR